MDKARIEEIFTKQGTMRFFPFVGLGGGRWVSRNEAQMDGDWRCTRERGVDVDCTSMYSVALTPPAALNRRRTYLTATCKCHKGGSVSLGTQALRAADSDQGGGRAFNGWMMIKSTAGKYRRELQWRGYLSTRKAQSSCRGVHGKCADVT